MKQEVYEEQERKKASYTKTRNAVRLSEDW